MNGGRGRKRRPVWQQSWFWIAGVTLAGAGFLLWVMGTPPPPLLPPAAEIEAAAGPEAAPGAAIERPLPDLPSIAVAPFAGAGDPAFPAELASAIAREVVAELHRDAGLFVIHFDSSNHFTAETPAREIAQALGVRYVMQGTLEERSGRLEFAVRFSDTVTGRVLWPGSLRVDPIAVSSLPTTLGAAAQIAVTGILADINVQDLMIPADAPDVVPAAWDQYLMGRAYAAAHTNEANALAAEAFAAALKIAPDFPAARIEHAFTRYYAQQGFEDDLTGPELPGLQVEVLAALQQEPGNPRGYELMSRLKLLDYTYLRAGDGERTNREQAMDFLERAVELAPGDPDLMSYRARLHTFARARSYYAEEYAEDAMRRHPWHDWTYTLHLAQNLQLQMVYDRALELLEPLAATHPDVLRIRREAALVYGLARDVDRGRVHMEAALTIDPTYGAGWETEDAIYDNPGNFQRDMESLRRVGLP